MIYPEQPAARDAWILARRAPRAPSNPGQPSASFVEPERSHTGGIVSVGTILLTNRECPWRCLMCDLWQHTLTTDTPPGAIPAQIQAALTAWSGAGAAPRQLKLYNSGSFFDPRAIPPEDHPAIATLARDFERVIVECHPALVNERVRRFRDQLGPGTRLEVAMGLETIHPEILPKLNKRMTKEQFARAAEFLRAHDIDLRVFVLLKPPFLDESDTLPWAARSIAFAFDCGATVVTLIPTRAGNGAMEELAAAGEFSLPKLETFEAALDQGLPAARGRLFGDLWDLEKFSSCERCLPARRERLRQLNLEQTSPPRVQCPACGRSAANPGSHARTQNHT